MKCKTCDGLLEMSKIEFDHYPALATLTSGEEQQPSASIVATMPAPDSLVHGPTAAAHSELL